MKCQVPGADTLLVYDLKGDTMVNPRALYDEGREEIEVDADLYLTSVRDEVPRGQALSLALGQPRGTVVNGPVVVIDAILNAIAHRPQSAR